MLRNIVLLITAMVVSCYTQAAARAAQRRAEANAYCPSGAHGTQNVGYDDNADEVRVGAGVALQQPPQKQQQQQRQQQQLGPQASRRWASPSPA